MSKIPTYEELECEVITLRKTVSENEHMERVFHSIAQSVMILDSEQNILSINLATEKLMGLSSGDLKGRKCYQVFHDPKSTSPPDACSFQRMVSAGKPETIEIIEETLKGTFLVSLTPVFDEKSKLRRVIHISTDITDKKKAEDALKKSEAQKKAILDASVDSIRLVDKEMRIVWANIIIETQLAKDRNKIIGNYCYNAYTGRSEPCPNCPTEKSLKSGKIEHSIICERNVKGIAGKSYWADYAVPIKNESGEIEQFIQVSRNVTELKTAEVALLEEKKKLETALAEVKRLSGLLPICSICKNIRDNNGYWNQIDAYIEDHSDVNFSHSICPVCAKKHYPDMDLYGD